MTHNKPIVLIGGPLDGMRYIVPAASKEFHAQATDGMDAATHTYAIQAIQCAHHAVFHVGVKDLNVCPILALVAGYRRPKKHDSELNVANQLVTLIGGAADGQHVPAQTGLTRVKVSFADTYDIVSLNCKDGTVVRVGVLDRLRVDPIPHLMAGYRFGEPK